MLDENLVIQIWKVILQVVELIKWDRGSEYFDFHLCLFALKNVLSMEIFLEAD